MSIKKYLGTIEVQNGELAWCIANALHQFDERLEVEVNEREAHDNRSTALRITRIENN